MQKDTVKTDVIFRVYNTKDFKGTVFAVFPHECSTLGGLVSTYQHVGQHSNAEYSYCIQSSKLALPEQYEELKKEMEDVYGYNLNVVKKRNYDKYLKSYHEIRKAS